jgi:hypothetical protein
VVSIRDKHSDAPVRSKHFGCLDAIFGGHHFIAIRPEPAGCDFADEAVSSDDQNGLVPGHVRALLAMETTQQSAATLAVAG